MYELVGAVERNRQRLRKDTYVPCEYVIALSPGQMKRMAEADFVTLMAEQLHEALQEYLNDKGYLPRGRLSVRLEEGEAGEDGYMQITTRYPRYTFPLVVPREPGRVCRPGVADRGRAAAPGGAFTPGKNRGWKRDGGGQTAASPPLAMRQGETAWKSE